MSLGRFIFSETPSGGCEISYEDVGEESDCEVIYKLDRNSRLMLEHTLGIEYSGSLPEMIEMKFGKCLEKEPFGMFLSSHKIRYELFTWYS